jgi:hypothetical protein
VAARTSKAGSPALDAALVALFVLVLALGLSVALRVGPAGSGRPDHPIRIQLLNGSGYVGLAGELASFLRDGGFDVLEVSNADRADYRTTLVVGRRPERGPARIVAEYLGTSHVIQQMGSQEMIDVTVIVGRDARRFSERR